MAYKFSKRSQTNLDQCTPVLKELMTRALMTSNSDFSVICGFRGEKEQNDAYARGASKLKWPNSAHNKTPKSYACDIAPYPLDWHDIAAFQALGEHVLEVWDTMKSEGHVDEWDLIWGGHFRSLKDFPHFEVRQKK